MSWISWRRSTSLPARQAVSSSVDRKICSRPRTGSESTPISASSPDVADETRSLNASASAISSGGGAENDFNTVIGMPALDRVAKAADAVRPFAPTIEALAPHLGLAGRVVVRRHLLPRRFALVDPR